MKKAEKNGASDFLETFKKYRSLLIELTRKSIKLKYRDSVLGILWSFVQPLLNMIVLSVVFGAILKRNNSNIICYPIFLFSGRLLFEFFTTGTKAALNSFRANASIIKKVYVPKYMYPTSAILSTFVTLGLSLLCFVCVWFFFKFTNISNGAAMPFNGYMLLAFIPIAILFVLVIGIGFILSVFQVYFRDIQYIWDIFCTLLFYMVPIIYDIKTINTDWIRLLIRINPLYHIISMFRDCMVECVAMNPKNILYSLAWALGSLLIGVYIFNKKSDDLIYHM